MKRKNTAKKVFALVIIAVVAFCAAFMSACDKKPDDTDLTGTLESIAVTKQPNKTEYEEGEKFKRSGMRVTAYYVGGTSKTVLGYKIDKEGPLTLEDTVITVTYQDKSTTVNITVREKEIKTHLTVASADPAIFKVEAEELDFAVDKEIHFEYHDDTIGNPATSGGISIGKLKENRDVMSLKINSAVEADFDLYAAMAYNPTIDFDAHVNTYWNDDKITTGWIVSKREDAAYDWFDWQEYAKDGLKLKVGYNELRFEVTDDSALFDYFRIEVNPVNSEAVSIAVTTPPVKTEYKEGEIFDPTGMAVTATFENGQTATVTGYTYYDGALALGETEVAVFYNGLQTTVPITVVERDMTLESITIEGEPIVTEYKVGDYFIAEGITVEAHYSDGITDTVIDYVIDKTEPLTESDTTVTISYGGKTAAVDIFVTANDVAAHAVVDSDTPRTVRLEIEKALFVQNTPGDTHNVESGTASGGAAVGNMKGSTTSVKFYVDSNVATSFDFALTVAHAHWAFNAQAVLYINGLRMNTDAWKCSGNWWAWQTFVLRNIALKEGRNVIEIVNIGGDRSDGGIQFDCVDISVNPVREFAIVSQPTKTEYNVGQTFDPAGMVVKATFADGTTREVSDYTVTPSGSLSVSDTKVTVSYGGFAEDINITVLAVAKLESIKIDSRPDKTDYYAGERFDPAGMVVKAVYSDGNEYAITNYTIVTEFVESGKPVIIRYEDKTADVAVTVTEPVAHVTFDKSHAEYITEFEDLDFEAEFDYVISTDLTNNADASGGKWLDGFDHTPAAKFTAIIYSEVDGKTCVELSIASALTSNLDAMWDFAWNGVDFESGIKLEGTPNWTWWPNGLKTLITSKSMMQLPVHKGYNYFVISIKGGEANVNVDCIRFSVMSDEIDVPTAPADKAHITIDSTESAYVLEFEDADWNNGGNGDYVMGSNASASGGAFVDGMSNKGGASFTINVYSETAVTVDMALSIASGAKYDLDGLWRITCNGQLIVTGAQTFGDWIPLGEACEVTSDGLSGIALRAGWNVITITVLPGSNINADYLKLTVCQGE